MSSKSMVGMFFANHSSIGLRSKRFSALSRNFVIHSGSDLCVRDLADDLLVQPLLGLVDATARCRASRACTCPDRCPETAIGARLLEPGINTTPDSNNPRPTDQTAATRPTRRPAQPGRVARRAAAATAKRSTVSSWRRGRGWSTWACSSTRCPAWPPPPSRRPGPACTCDWYPREVLPAARAASAGRELGLRALQERGRRRVRRRRGAGRRRRRWRRGRQRRAWSRRCCRSGCPRCR